VGYSGLLQAIISYCGLLRAIRPSLIDGLGFLLRWQRNIQDGKGTGKGRITSRIALASCIFLTRIRARFFFWQKYGRLSQPSREKNGVFCTKLYKNSLTLPSTKTKNKKTIRLIFANNKKI
jgi:hypothetical protein